MGVWLAFLIHTNLLQEQCSQFPPTFLPSIGHIHYAPTIHEQQVCREVFQRLSRCKPNILLNLRFQPYIKSFEFQFLRKQILLRLTKR